MGSQKFILADQKREEINKCANGPVPDLDSEAFKPKD
jgi:hypothetical protein